MAVTTPDELVKLLEKSKILDEERLAQARQAAQQADDARALAKALIRQGWLTRWQAGQLLAGRAAFHLGKYKLIDLLGSGGMGRVFLAEHTTMGRRVALKILPKRLGRDPALLKQFLTEARAIAALDHPNIVHPYSVDGEGDRYYLVMEYIEGRDLQRMVEADGPLPFDRAARYIQQAADGLAHAHSRDMIHCDVKPANLLVSRQDTVKILDMGMARLIGRGEDSANEKDDRLLGTVDYLAPEQAVESPDLDHRADVYSLGCTFYFLLTGQPPFPEGTLHERILKHQTEAPRKIAELRSDTPDQLAEICEKMMAKDPDERFQSAGDVSEALSKWQPEEEPEAAAVVLEPAEEDEDEESHAADVGDDETPAAAETGGTSTLLARAKAMASGPRRMLLFAGGGGAVALILLVGVLFFLVGLGEEGDETPASQIAASDTGPQAGRSADDEPSVPKEGATEDDSEWPELPDLGNLRDFDPEAVFDAKTGDSAKSQAPPKPKEPAPSKPQPKQAESEKPKPDPPKPEKPDEQAKPEAKPAEKAAADKPVTEKPEAEKPKPEKPEPAKPEPAKTAPDAKKPEEKKPEKPKPKKPEGPLRELAEAIDLPELGGGGLGGQPGEPFTLGKIHSGPDVPWQLYLLGGQTAMKKGRTFALKQDQTEAAQASWLVQLETTTGSGDPTLEDMAKIRREGDTLKFQWAEGAPSSANYLRNCILQVRVEGESKYVTLNTPKMLEPIPIDLEMGVGNAKLPVKWLPDAGTLRVQITKVEGREGHAVDPPEPADPEKPLLLSFPRTNRHGNTVDRVAFRVNFTPRTTAVQVKLQLLEPPRDAFRNLKGNAPLLRTQLELKRDEVNKKLHPTTGEPPRGTEKSKLDAEFDNIEMNLWYINFYEEVQGKATIHFRLFTEVDGREVVLAATQQAAEPAPKES
ncbi:MAG TPA: serine/threonine-protein kinase [Thermoguttaceae bacterium]|nr:serine/threonine-protein kinase [Thermoguttaceae bacterium]